MPSFTKQAIIHSFLKLLKEKPLEKITIKYIVEDCGINRNTFYYYFSDIASYLSSLCDEKNNGVAIACDQFGNMYLCEKQKSDINNEPSIHAAFRTLNWFLKKYYKYRGAESDHNEEFDVLFKEDIDSFHADAQAVSLNT